MYLCQKYLEMMKHKFIFILFISVIAIPMHAQSYNELFDQASKYEAQDSLEAAIRVYKKAIEKDPTNIRNSMLFANVARAQRRLGQTKDALLSYGFALNMTPLSSAILMDRATLYADLGDNDHAIIDCNNILDIQKDNKEALTLRSYLLYKLRRYQEAQADYTHLLLMDPTDLVARVGLATLYEMQEKFHQSMEILNALIVERPNDPEMYVMRANLDKDLILYDYALMDINKAIQVAIKPTPDMWIFRGDMLLHKKEKNEARGSYQTAIKLGASRAMLMERIRRCKRIF
jgi:tetratricopeptide (TPR) repeat protein